MNICTKCKIEKEDHCFSKDKGRKTGLFQHCKECVKLYNLVNKERNGIRAKQSRNENLEERKAKSRESYAKNKENWKPAAQEYKKKNKHKCAEYSRNWRKRNPERAKEVFEKWAKANPDKVKQNNKNYSIKYRGKVTDKANRRYAKKLQAMPGWLTKEHLNQIKELYIESARLTDETGVEYNVDHIIPLQSDLVCGLHVPWNLRIITREENLKKSNRIIDGT